MNKRGVGVALLLPLLLQRALALQRGQWRWWARPLSAHRLVFFFYAAAAVTVVVAIFCTFYLAMPIFLRGARFHELQDVNERGADAKYPQIGCLVACWLHPKITKPDPSFGDTSKRFPSGRSSTRAREGTTCLC